MCSGQNQFSSNCLFQLSVFFSAADFNYFYVFQYFCPPLPASLITDHDDDEQ